MSGLGRWIGAAVASCVAALLTAPPSGAVPPGDPGDGTPYRRTTLDALATAPAALRDERIRAPDSVTVTAIVELAAPSVAEASGEALAAGGELSAAETRAVRDAAEAEQAAFAERVAAQGGEVEATYQDAINAVTVAVPAAALTELEALPVVVRIRPVRLLERTNAQTNAYTGVTTAWQDLGVTGEGVTIALIDDGVDYTHAGFGGPGTVDAYTSNDPTVVEDGTFPTAKVVGGVDFVGDDYDASSTDPSATTPVPDLDPLGCGDHGTHVAGTAAGNGVRSDGTPYTGPYDPQSVAAAGLRVDPGAAPEARLLAYKVFGCEGATTSDVVVAAIDRAVADGADVINLSLGSPWGRADDPDSIAASNAVRAGVVVVAAAGNDGPNAYLTGSPAAGAGVLSVAAMDAGPFYPGASISSDASGGSLSVAAINANAGALPVTAPLHIVRDEAGSIGLGCSAEEFGTVAAGAIAVVARGSCPRIDKVRLGQRAGAQAVVQVNDGPGFPPFEGAVPGVDVPFLGVRSDDGPALSRADGQAVTVTSTGTLPNPGYTRAADFTAGGPRTGDAAVKPELTAPGVSLRSAAAGTGSLGINLSGTSMSSPHVAGIAALIVQARPDWPADLVRAALVNTATAAPPKLGELRPLLDGAGLVDAVAALSTDVLALGRERHPSISFSVAELLGGFRGIEQVTFANSGPVDRIVDLTVVVNGDGLGAAVTVSPDQVVVPAGGGAVASLQVSLPPEAVAALPGVDHDFAVTALTGRLLATPVGDGTPLAVPFQLVPYGRSRVVATGARGGGGELEGIGLRNFGLHAGAADLYEWVLRDGRDPGSFADLRAVGVQSFDVPPGFGSQVAGDRLLVFAFSLHQRFSSAAENQYELLIDTDGDEQPDHLVVAADAGLLLDGDPSGELASFAIDLVAENVAILPVIAPPDGSVLLVPVLASDLDRSPEAATFAVTAATSSAVPRGHVDLIEDSATVDAYQPQRSAGDYLALPPGGTGAFSVTARVPRADEVASLGWMVVTLDDRSGAEQAALVPA